MMRRKALIAAYMLVSACGMLDDLAPSASPPAPAAGAVEPGWDMSKLEAGAVPGGAAPEGPPVALAPRGRKAPLPRPKPTLIEPRTLVGLSPDEVRALFGPPETVDDRPPSAVWRYRSQGCSLDLFFYLDVATRTFRALTYEVRESDGTSPPLCLGRLREAAYGS